MAYTSLYGEVPCSFWFLIRDFWDRRPLHRSDTLRFLKHGTGHAVECLNVDAGLAQRHLFFCIRDTNRDTLVFLRPETSDVATRVSGRK